MAAPLIRSLSAAVHLNWTHIWKSRAYQHGTFAERRMIELRYSVARAVRDHRRKACISQKQLASWLGTGQGTISRIECASMRVSLDQAIYAFIALNVKDADIAQAVDAGARRDVQRLRELGSRRFAKRPSAGFLRAMRRQSATGPPAPQPPAVSAVC
jgi:transcriptional regulator with XRE-family HTH domain